MPQTVKTVFLRQLCALSTDHQKKVSKGVSPYGDGTAVSKILSLIEKLEISKIKNVISLMSTLI